MQELIKSFAINLFSNPTIATIFVSMFPVIEVKGAIPFGQSTQIWGTNALSHTWSFICAILGGLITSSILLAVLKVIFYFLNKNDRYKHLTEKIKGKLKNKVKKVESTSKLKTYFCLFAFVAIPLPLTGIWSGTLIAALLNLDYLKSLIILNLGNLVAGLIISLLSFISKDIAIYIFYFFALFLILTIVYYVAKIVITNLKARQ